MSRPFLIGEILVEHAVLSEQQVFEIVQAQRKLHLPFGVLAERMFEVTLESIEKAWIEQYHRTTGTIDLANQAFDRRALSLITRRQAWQFEILPIRIEKEGDVLVAASRRRLARAVTFAANRIDNVVFFRVADSLELRQYLKKFYAMPEISQSVLEKVHDMSHAG